MADALVSVIIPTYNSGNTLGLCLSSINSQSYQNIEVIIVDNYSQDDTVKLAEEAGSLVYLIASERAEAKNIGASKATGEFAFFIDSDMELTKYVVEDCFNLIKSDPGIGGIIVPERSIGNSYWVRVRDFERKFYAGAVVESARFFKRSVVEEAGGFEESIVSYEESTLPQKIEDLGYIVRARINAEILHHEEDFSLSFWLRKKYYYGKSAKNYHIRYPAYSHQQFSKINRLTLFLTNRLFYKKPLLALSVLLLKFVEYCSYKIGQWNIC